jgi:hypothetical protein
MPGSKEIWDNMDEDFFSDLENEHRPSGGSSGMGEVESPESKKNIIPNERVAFLLFPFFIEMIGQFIDTLKTLGHYTRRFQEKMSGKEMGVYLNRIITEDIVRVELLEKSVLNYIRMDNPILRKDTVNIVLEEELKKYRVELEEKKIKLFETLEKGLPEAAVPDDQLRYLLSCLLQYVMTIIPFNGKMGLFTRSLVLQKERGEGQASGRRGERYIEVLMVYMLDKEPMKSSGAAFGIQTRQEEGILGLTLRLIDEIIKRNRGTMTFEVDEKKAKTTISLRFPVERRKVVYYQPVTELSSKMHPSKSTFEKLSSLEKMREKG